MNATNSYYLGIDIGSGTSKGVITSDGKPLAMHLLPSGNNYRATARKLRDELLAKAGLSPKDIAYTVATGHGAAMVESKNEDVDTIRTCARGINRIFPTARTVIDIQGQSTQVIKINEKGRVLSFVVSEKCAAGSGRFLDVISNVLRIKLEEVGPLSLKSSTPVKFTTGCAVFGESEAISRVSEGASKEDILAGVHLALATKASTLVERVGMEKECAISGGGALNIGLVKAIEQRLGLRLLVPPQPQFVTALGAAIMAEERAQMPHTDRNFHPPSPQVDRQSETHSKDLHDLL
ncbi:MAG: 2-hydroxyglutaryl-CoA dehydratase [Chloroflexi bacterium]|nr:2-hydroxyglutaryl-CoA dehydratase [Chloroflexota bacterium]